VGFKKEKGGENGNKGRKKKEKTIPQNPRESKKEGTIDQGVCPPGRKGNAPEEDWLEFTITKPKGGGDLKAGTK